MCLIFLYCAGRKYGSPSEFTSNNNVQILGGDSGLKVKHNIGSWVHWNCPCCTGTVRVQESTPNERGGILAPLIRNWWIGKLILFLKFRGKELRFEWCFLSDFLKIEKIYWRQEQSFTKQSSAISTLKPCCTKLSCHIPKLFSLIIDVIIPRCTYSRE